MNSYIPDKEKILKNYRTMFELVKENLDQKHNDFNEMNRRFEIDIAYIEENLK